MTGLTSQVTFRVTDAVYDLIQRIAERERRKPNEVARALLERGAASYARDGRLFEPEAGDARRVADLPVTKAFKGAPARDKKKVNNG